MMPQEKNAALLEISHLKKYYPIRSGLLQRKEEYVKAVDDVSLSSPPWRNAGPCGGKRMR